MGSKVTDFSADLASKDLAIGTRFIVHSPMLAMRAGSRGKFVTLQKGASGEIVESHGEIGEPGVVVIAVNGERFFSWRRDLAERADAERADVVLSTSVATPALSETAERLRLRWQADAEAARRRLIEITSDLRAAVLDFPGTASAAEAMQKLQQLGWEHRQTVQDFLNAYYKTIAVDGRTTRRYVEARSAS